MKNSNFLLNDFKPNFLFPCNPVSIQFPVILVRYILAGFSSKAAVEKNQTNFVIERSKQIKNCKEAFSY